MLVATGFWGTGGGTALATAIGAGVGALVGGLVGAFATLKATKQSIDSAKKTQSETLIATEKMQEQSLQTQIDLAAKQRQHERDEAREARVQERFQNTYIDLLDHLARTEQHIRLMTALLRPVNQESPLQPDVGWWQLTARVQAYATDAVRDGMAEVQKLMVEFAIAYAGLEGEKEQRAGVQDLVGARQKLNSAGEKVLDAITRARSAATDDLRRRQSDPD